MENDPNARAGHSESQRDKNSPEKKTSKSGRGKQVYLNAAELHQLRSDLEMLLEVENDEPEKERRRRQSLADKIGELNRNAKY